MTEEQITNRYVRGWISLAEYRAELVKFYDREDAREKAERDAKGEGVVMITRQTVELVSYEMFYSDDNWETVWHRRDGDVKPVTDKHEADRIRFIAIMKYGGGRDDEQVRT